MAKKIFISLTALLLLATATVGLLQTGLARKAFFELFAYVKGVEVLGPTVVRELPNESPYEAWLARSEPEIPIHKGVVIEDIEHVALRPWPQLGTGVTGLYLRFADYQITDGRIIEIPANGNSISQRNFYEQGIYLLTGSGYTILQQEGKPEQRVDWQQGDLFPVPLNVRHTETRPWDYRGEGTTTMRWLMAGNSMLSLHVSEMPPNQYSKAHRHSIDAFILFLSGTGFSLTWPEAAFEDHLRVDWKAGTLFVPPMYWYHQHLNTGSTPARYLAINTPAFVRNIGLRFSDQLEVDIIEVRDAWNRAIETEAAKAERH